MVRDMTKGKPIKLIISFGLPLLIGNLFQQLYNMVDSSVVGHFVGKNALAAVGSTGSLMFMIMGFIIGLTSGFSIPISKYFGAGDQKNMRKCVAHSIYLTLIIAVVMTTIAVLSIENVLRLMKTPDNIFADAYAYISIICAGISAILFYNMLAAILRAIGDSKTPLYFLMLTTVLNIILDLVFVVKFSWGVKGVAIATVISQLVSGLLCFIHIKRHFFILHLRAEDMKIDTKICKELLYTGLPMGFQMSITALGAIMLQSSVNALGSDIVAAVTAASRIQLMLIQPGETIGITMATYCGQNLGAKRIDRIQKGVNQSLLLSLAYSVGVFFVGQFAGKYIALLFLKKSEVLVLGYVEQFLKINSCFYPVLSVLFVYRNSLQGLGYSMPALTAGISELFARGIFGMLIVPKFGFIAVCFANPGAWIAGVLILIPVYYYVMRRIKRKYKISSKNIGNPLDSDVASQCIIE
ncbi:MAG TPA: MATE family efflux transporter [Clostridia bacterium]|nr:MATE family efflux transporter [Clostridia bacterium]